MLIRKILQRLLQTKIQGQLQILARHRLYAIIMLHHITGHVNLFHKGTVLASQDLIIALFQTGFAYNATLSNIFKEALLNFVGANLAHIAQGVYAQLLIGIITYRLNRKHHLRHVPTLLLDFRNHFQG